MPLEVRCKVECRAGAEDTGPGRIVGTLIEMGRIAGDRREIFTPDSIQWPAGGVRLLSEHRGREVMRFVPKAQGSQLLIDEPLPDSALGRELAREIRTGVKAGLSIEFHAVQEAVVSGVREVRRAIVDAAAAVGEGAYDQATVEVRHKRRAAPVWL